jgi:hypothetical protein
MPHAYRHDNDAGKNIPYIGISSTPHLPCAVVVMVIALGA